MGWLGDILKIAAPVGGFLVGGPAGAMAGAGIAQGIGAGENQSKANDLTQQAYNTRMGEWNADAPLRARARQVAMQGVPQRPDFSAIFSDPGNPYAKNMRTPQVASWMPPNSPAAPVASAPQPQVPTTGFNVPGAIGIWARGLGGGPFGMPPAASQSPTQGMGPTVAPFQPPSSLPGGLTPPYAAPTNVAAKQALVSGQRGAMAGGPQSALLAALRARTMGGAF